MLKNTNNFECPIQTTVNVLGGKWKFVILHYLIDGNPKRFKELERCIGGISPKMLIKELKDLEFNKIVQRKQYNTIPPCVEYTLSEYGKNIIPVLEALKVFGEEHNKMMLNEL